MKMLLLVEHAPYGSEGPYNALRLADALLERGEWIDLFFMGDGVHAARAGQDPSGADVSVEGQLRSVMERGAEVMLCGTCRRSRGLAPEHTVEGARISTVRELADLVAAPTRW
jgi:sulfur relay (sulfurtransferase) complex TusBCD TusD component (DsrE family)